MSIISAGRLNQRIQIWHLEYHESDYGDTTYNYVMGQDCRAMIDHVSGSREVVNDEIFNTFSKTFTVRMNIDVRDTDRIKWNDKFYQVTYIEPDRSRMIKTVQTELVNQNEQ